MTTDQLHQSILKQLRQHARSEVNQGVVYLGSSHSFYGIDAVTQKMIVKNVKKQINGSFVLLAALLDKLYRGQSYDERALAGRLLGVFPKWQSQLDFSIFESWLGQLVGWAEVDDTCQSTFSAKEMLSRWPEWQKFLKKISRDTNINKRRASLVLLIKPLRGSDDQRLSKLAFLLVDRLKSEREILITKAVSWILRSMIKHHPRAVAEYVEKNWRTLPPVAVREVGRKLVTGRK